MTRRRTILLLLALGVATFAVAAPTWVSTVAATALDPDVVVTSTGTAAAPGVGAGGLVLVAAALALGLVGRVGRWVVLTVAAGSGVVVGASALSFLAAPEVAARSAVVEATGVTDLVAPVEVSALPAVAAGLGAVVVLVSVWAAVSSRAWESASARHERPGGSGVGAPAGEHRDGPDGIPAGGDGPGDESAGGTPEASGPGTTYDEHEAWDALTRGEDPSADEERR